MPIVVPPDTHLPVLPAALQKRREEIIPLEPDVYSHSSPPASPPLDPSVPALYPVVALGGTFDHLHAGHKILLSMGAWIARRKLIVGITGASLAPDLLMGCALMLPLIAGDALLGKKEHRSVLEPLPVRTARTRAFLELFRPGIEHDLVPINDVFGPTGWDADIQALVVSKETLSGASSSASILVYALLVYALTMLCGCSRETARRAGATGAAHVRDRCHLCDGGERGRGGCGGAPDREDEQHVHPRVDRQEPETNDPFVGVMNVFDALECQTFVRLYDTRVLVKHKVYAGRESQFIGHTILLYLFVLDGPPIDGLYAGALLHTTNGGIDGDGG